GWFGTAGASEVCLQGGVASKACIDFDHPMSSGQQADKGIVELVDRRVLDCLLGNAHPLADGAKHIQLPQFHSQGRQTRTGRKMSRRFRGRFLHDDGPPISGFTSFDRYDPSSFFWQVPFCWQHTATTLDKI